MAINPGSSSTGKVKNQQTQNEANSAKTPDGVGIRPDISVSERPSTDTGSSYSGTSYTGSPSSTSTSTTTNQSATPQQTVSNVDEQKGRARDAAIADAAEKAQKKAKKNAPSAKSAATMKASNIDTSSQTTTSNAKEAPQILHGDGSISTGYLDVDTGEVVDTSSMDNAYFAPPTMSNSKPIESNNRVTFFEPGTQISEETRKSLNAKIKQRQSGEQQNVRQNTIRPSDISGIPNTDIPTPQNRASSVERSVDQVISEDLPNDSIFYRNIRREKDKEGNYTRSPREDFNAHMRNIEKNHDWSKEFPNRRTTANEALTTGELAPGINKYDEARYRLRRSQDLTQAMFMRGYLPIEGMTIDRNGNIVYTPEVEAVREQMKKMYGLSDTGLNRLIILRAGISIDNDSKIMNTDPSEWNLTEQEFVAICNQVAESQRLYGHPLGLLSEPIIIAGSYRFPMGHIPSALAKELTNNKNSILYGKSYLDLMNEVGEHYVSKVRPTIMVNTKGDKISQRLALDNMMRALVGLDGIRPEQYQVTSDVSRCLDEMIEASNAEMIADPSNADVVKNRMRTFERNRNRIEKQLKRKPIKDENGHIVGYEVKERGRLYNALTAAANVMKTVGVIASPAIIISGIVEHGLGNLVTLESNICLGMTKGKDYRINDSLRKLIVTDEAKDTIAAAKTLYNVGGMEAVDVFFEQGLPVTKESVQKFLNEHIRGIVDPKKQAQARTRLNNWMRDISDILMPGDWGFRGSDARRWLEMFMINMSQNAKSGKPSVTTAQVMEAINSGGIGKFVAQAMKYPEGRDAFIATRNMNLARISPLTAMINQGLRKHGVTNFLIVSGLDTYISYGVNLIQVFLPFSNTLSYIATRGLTRTSSIIKGESEADSIARDNQLGGNDKFFQGLTKNLIYDAVKLGNMAVITLIMYEVIKALGFDDPDDDDQKWMYDEYKIGGEKVRLAWWANDLIGWGWPLAIAMHVREKHPEDPERAINVFLDGVHDMINGSSIMDAAKFITDSNENLSMIREMILNPDANVDPDKWISETNKVVEGYFATLLGKFTPGILKRGYKEPFFGSLISDSSDRDRDAYKVYDRSSDDKTKTKSVDDELEAWRRRISQNNPLYAIWNNIVHNGYLFDDGTGDKTGYLFYEQPIATMKDPMRAAYINEFEFDPEDPSIPQDKESREQWLEEQATRLISSFDRWDSPEQAIANGYAIGYNARKNAIDYIYKQILLTKLDHAEKASSGYYKNYTEKDLAYQRMNKTVSGYYDILNKWLKNEDIPWSDAGYEKLLTDYQVYYTWKDSGKLATAWDALWAGDAVEKRYKPYGNTPTSLLPFTTVNSTGGYNEETLPNWYVEGLTDTERVFEESQKLKVPYGQDEGQSLSSVLFGGQPDGTYNISPSETPTINRRGYVASENALPESIKNISEKTIAADLGIDLDEIENNMKDGTYSNKNNDSKNNNGSNKNYNTWKTYSGGSYDNSSYNPKIYSSSKSVSADRAASMYVKQPYGATVNYLRPSFRTKGSREAYARQDF